MQGGVLKLMFLVFETIVFLLRASVSVTSAIVPSESGLPIFLTKETQFLRWAKTQTILDIHKGKEKYLEENVEKEEKKSGREERRKDKKQAKAEKRGN